MPSKIQLTEAYEFGDFRLDLVVRQLFHKGKPVQLSSRTFDILKILAQNRGQVVMKEELIRRVWPDRFIEENNLTVRMSALRKALGESVENRFIETVPTYGYRFVARVSEIFHESMKQQQQVEEEEFDSLAVLPLIDESNQQKLNYLCDGITDSLITSLSHIANLRVMARSTVFRYKGREFVPQKVGEELGVRAILVGKVNQAANSLLFDMEMIDVKDGAYLWGARYKRRVSDLVTLQEELAREISEKLRVKLNKFEEHNIAKRYTDNPKAYQMYMKGRYFLNKRNVWWLKRAVRYFRSAIRLDPQYALAYAGLADTYRMVAGVGLRPARETIPKGKAVALKALELDNQLAEAHLTLANIKSSYEFDWQGAEREFKLALELNVYDAQALQYYSNFLAKTGQVDQAIAAIDKAYEIDPLSLSTNLAMGKLYHFARRYDDALKKGREILDLEPQYGPAHGLIGISYLEMERFQEAIREFKIMFDSLSNAPQVLWGKAGGDTEKRITQDWDPEALALMGYAYAVAGNRNKALKVLDELGALMNKRYVQPHNVAMVYIGLRDNDKAFEWLDRALADRCSPLTYIKVWSFFDGLRTDPRYEQLVRRIGLSP